jgi:16S rRNA processing protein RimM
MQKEDCYYLGKITKPHGFKGNLIVHLETDEPELYENMESVFVDTNGMLVPFFFEFAQVHGANKLLVKFEDTSPEEAEKLINKDLYLPLESLPELDGTDFYYHEIIGFTLFDQTNTEVGLIKSINDATAQALFELEIDGKEILVPIVDEWILEVDRENKAILVEIPDGLIDLYLG